MNQVIDEEKISMNNKKNISILGSTGSIGTQTLDVCRNNPELFSIEGISTNKNIKLIFEQILEFSPKKVCIFDVESCTKFSIIYSNLSNKDCIVQNMNGDCLDILNNNFLIDDINEYIDIVKEHIKSKNITDCNINDIEDIARLDILPEIELYHGLDGLINISKSTSIDTLVTAVVGMIGLLPTVEAIKNSTTIALANKETLVTAGKIVMDMAKKCSSKIIPVDSEHSAIFQCLNGEVDNKIDKILLTASGGPFRGMKKDDITGVKSSDALKHPNWSMGKKISIDSSTLMNKGLEVIEARWLFDVEPQNIEVYVHPQSIVHSMVQFEDSSVIAQLGCPDMKVPIQYALTYPKRIKSNFETLDLFSISKLTFEKPDTATFPCIELAYKALEEGGTFATVLNAANEVLVEMFLNDEINFYDIPRYIEIAMNTHPFIKNPTLDDIIEMDKWTRKYIQDIINDIS